MGQFPYVISIREIAVTGDFPTDSLLVAAYRMATRRSKGARLVPNRALRRKMCNPKIVIVATKTEQLSVVLSDF